MQAEKRIITLRKVWLKVHRYLGLTLGAMFAVIGLTGSLIVFWQPLDALLNPDLFKTTTRCALSLYRPLDDIVAAAQSHAPANGKLRSLSFPNPERPVFTAAYEAPAPGTDWDDRYIVFVEPCNGLVTGSRFYDSQLKPLGGPLMGVVIRIHSSLLLNFPGLWLGNYLISFGSVFIACSILIGVYACFNHWSRVSMSCFTSSAVWLMIGIPKRETCAIKPANGISANFAERAIDNSPSLNRAVANALRTPGKSMILEDLRPTIKVSGSFLFMTKTRSSCAIRNASLGLFFKPLTFTVFMGISHRNII
jgi:hypothetical protein